MAMRYITALFIALLSTQAFALTNAEWLPGARSELATKNKNIEFTKAWQKDACARMSAGEINRCNALFSDILVRREFEKAELITLIGLVEKGMEENTREILSVRYNQLNEKTNTLFETAASIFPREPRTDTGGGKKK